MDVEREAAVAIGMALTILLKTRLTFRRAATLLLAGFAAGQWAALWVDSGFPFPNRPRLLVITYVLASVGTGVLADLQKAFRRRGRILTGMRQKGDNLRSKPPIRPSSDKTPTQEGGEKSDG